MEWSDIGRSLISQGSPLIGGLLSGPAGPSAGKLIAGLFSVDPDDVEEVMNAIQSDPEAITKIRELESNHKQALEELQLEETKAFLHDVVSARQRELALDTATGKQDRHLHVIAYTVLGAFFALILILIIGELGTFNDGSTANRLRDNPLIMMIVGALISGFTQVLSYFFGSSKGSSEKNKMLSPKG